ncbi:MAG: NAD(P)/FAD-dependent oxidoreductase [Oscillospiraceae bacterium]|jgi:sarcosine oxidase subunit alpha|nr:NAD(P)/FAD-dependent oxidoreductase [Oscillospiraceae bacterium]
MSDSTSRELVIIGAGPAGLAAAISAYDSGCRDILILERDSVTGGILNQCIHNGFGLHYFGEELTGPEYAARFADMVEEKNFKEHGIDIWLSAMVIGLNAEKEVTVVSKERGIHKINAKAVILAMGCRERARGAIGIPGVRAAGIMTAGTAQRFSNLEGLMVGKRVFILGSGDIGLIMARRLTLEGAKVLACAEIMPYSSGLRRNIVQCLDDYGIPLLLSHTVTNISGEGRVSAVTVSRVDDNLVPIEGSETVYECDTLILSVGLIPENELSLLADVEMDSATNGARVDQNLSTSVDGIFSCGNVLHVHDLADNVSKESIRAGAAAVRYIGEQRGMGGRSIPIVGGNGVTGVLPQSYSYCEEEQAQPLSISFRASAKYRKAYVSVKFGDAEVRRVLKQVISPGEMESVSLSEEIVSKIGGCDRVTVEIEE